MGLLDQVTKGKIKKPSMDLIYGGPGVGKSTWAAGAPKPIFLPTEEGTNNLDVARLPLMKKYADLMSALEELKTTPHAFQTLVIDSLDHLELLIWDETIIAHRIRDRADFIAYARGYELALPYWQKLVAALKDLREKMSIILICHSQVKTINDPLQTTAYDSHDLKLHKKASAIIVETCDSVLFAAEEISVKDSKTGKSKAYGEGKRVLYTRGMPGHTGKNRDNLPYELPLDYKEFAKAKEAASGPTADQIIATIMKRLDLVADEKTRTNVIKSIEIAATSTAELTRILTKLETLQK